MGDKTEKEGEKFRTDDQLLMWQDIFLCQIFIFCSFFVVVVIVPKDIETWPSKRGVSERFLFYNVLKLFPYG